MPLSTPSEPLTPAAQHKPWSEVPVEQISAQVSRQFVTGSQVMLARVELKAGAITARHSHANEQISYVESGVVLFHIGEDGAIEDKILHAGDTLVLPGHLTHGADAIEDSVILDIFAPPRHDWIKRP
jgi:quercetin dioxygenase-like cupin family protein